MKNKIKVITEVPCEHELTLDRQVEKWLKRNPQVNVVSTEISQGSFTTSAKIAIIYNE